MAPPPEAPHALRDPDSSGAPTNPSRSTPTASRIITRPVRRLATRPRLARGRAAAATDSPQMFRAGGDLRFISTSAAGQIVRLMLADISGHGADAEIMARRLRGIVRKHINKPNPARFTRALNWELSRTANDGAFATAIITTYFAPTDHLILCNAGHPRPLLYRSRLGRWELFDETVASALPSNRASETGVRNLPLGVIAGVDYPMFATRLDQGDMVVLYTDALIEAANADGDQLGEDGFLAAAQASASDDPAQVGPDLLAAASNHRDGPCEDDQTIIVLSHTGTNPTGSSVGRLKSLGRLVGLG